MILLKGLLLGFLIAAPIGPIGVLCIQRTLNKGRFSGFVSGLGAATADAFYGAVAAFGLSIISNFLIEQQLILRLVGGAFLLYFGVKSFYSKTKEFNINMNTNTKLASDYLSTVFLTMTNPMTIISFIAVFTGTGFLTGSLRSASLLVVGVFLGSALWWLTLSLGVGWIKSKINNFSLNTLNKVSGIVIIIFALLILFEIFK